MSKVLNIFLPKVPNLKTCVEKSLSKLETLGFDLTLVELDETGIDIKQTAFTAIKNGQIDIAIFHLPDLLPVHPSEDLIIAALSERQNAQDCLIIYEDNYDPTADLRLKSGTIVHVSSNVKAAQLKNLNASIDTFVSDQKLEKTIDLVKTGEVKAAMIPKLFFDSNTIASNIRFVNLHPKEMIPTPGQGTFAFVTLTENLALRRILKTIHEKETSEITNVERKVRQMSLVDDQPNVAVYCYKDNNANFHAIGAYYDSELGSLQFASQSQSTSDGLADVISHSLNHK